MNLNIKALFVAIAIVAITGCAKEIDFSLLPRAGTNCKLINLTANLGVLGSYSVDLVYDAQGRVSKTTDGSETTTYSYPSNKITVAYEDGSTDDITLVNGRATMSLEKGFFGSDFSREYTYNAEGYLSLVKNYFGGNLNSTDELTYENGNLKQSKVTYTTDNSVETTTYEYSSELARNVYDMSDPLTSHVAYVPGGFFGKQSKNVMTKSTTGAKDNAGVKTGDVISNLSYQFNAANGTASTLTIVQIANTYLANGTLSGTDTYTSTFNMRYDCTK